jgi:hypothetical protein
MKLEEMMRKILLALCAVAVIAAGTIAAPTPSRANGLVVAAIVVGAVLATVFVAHAVARPAYADRDHRRWPRRHPHPRYRN